MIYKFVGHELNVDFWESKESLMRSFYTDFYNFIKSKKYNPGSQWYSNKIHHNYFNFN